jgi:chromate transporter
MMRVEVVEKRRWLSEGEFLDLVGASSLIPGPNSTELAIHVGRERAGWRGLLVAGACFIVPATLIVLALAALYVAFGSTPPAEALLYGIQPVVVAIVAYALWGFLRTAVKGAFLAAVGLAALALYLFGVAGELPLLFGGAFLVLCVRLAQHRGAGGQVTAVAPFGVPLGLLAAPAVSIGPFGIFLSFLKIGAVLFGSGYVLLAFLRSEFVAPGFLTEQQLIDAVAIGQVTPGPVFTTATFIGYVLAGVPGAVLATVGIFLPAFVFVALTGPIIPRLRRSPVLAGLLDGANIVSLALMAGVTLQLGETALRDPLTVALGLASLALLFLTKLNSAWLILAGGVIGLAARSFL